MATNTRKLQLLVAFSTLLLLAVAAGCRGFFVNPTLTTVTVGPQGASIEQGKTLQMTATGTYDDGSTKTLTANVLWTSADTTVVSVNGTGLVTGKQFGSTSITATSGTISGSTTITVVLGNITRIDVTPTSQSIPVGGEQQYTAIATVQGGQQFDITSSAQWQSSNTSVATIDTSGLATAVAAGTTQITATSDNITSNAATLTVTAQ